MDDNAAFLYVRWIPALLGMIAVWIVVGSVGERIARKHAATRSNEKCPRCEMGLKAVRQGFRHYVAAKVFLVDITRYACHQCGFRQSIWKA